MDGQTAEEPRVRFGDRPSQTMPAEWAEVMLKAFAAEHPLQFGKLLARAALGDSNGHRG